MGIIIVPTRITVRIKSHKVYKALSIVPGTQWEKEINLSCYYCLWMRHQWTELETIGSVLWASHLVIISRILFFFFLTKIIVEETASLFHFLNFQVYKSAPLLKSFIILLLSWISGISPLAKASIHFSFSVNCLPLFANGQLSFWNAWRHKAARFICGEDEHHLQNGKLAFYVLRLIFPQKLYAELRKESLWDQLSSSDPVLPSSIPLKSFWFAFLLINS